MAFIDTSDAKRGSGVPGLINPVLIAAGLLVLAGCQSTPDAAGTKVQYVQIDGARLPYVERGKGEPVVLVHGAVSDYRTWAPQQEALSKNYRVFAYTQRYFGTETWSKDGPPFGVQTHSDDLVAFIRGLDVGPVHLAAWSYGGHIAFNVALHHPELVKSAFVFEPAVPSYVTDPAQLKAFGDDAGAMMGPLAKAVQGGDNAGAARVLIDGVGERAGYFDAMPARLQAIVLDSAHTMPALTSNKPPQISCAQLNQIKPPVAVARGEMSRPFFRVVADGAASCMPKARRVIVPQAKHMWPAEDPEGFSRELATFFKGG